MPFPTHRCSPTFFSSVFLLLGTLTLLAGGCTPATKDRDVLWAETSADAIDVMSKPRGALGLRGVPNAVWVDPRAVAVYEAGHIPGAVNLPFERLESEQGVVFSNVDVIVVYDSDYDTALPLAYAKRLISLGYDDVYCLRGGLKAWKRDGNPVATGPAAPADPKTN